MSYIGQGLPADVFSGFTTDAFTGDGSATTFTLSKAPFSEDGLIVVINNVIQRPTTNFTVSGTTLTIVGTAVASGDVIYAIHTSGAVPSTLASKVDVNGVSDAVILDADGDTTISADTDDQIDFKAGGTDVMSMTATGLTINDGVEITTADNTDTLTLTSTDADANAGPNLRLYRNSSSPAVSDVIGVIEIEGRNDNSEDIIYQQYQHLIADETDGTEDGYFIFNQMKAGTLTERYRIETGTFVINDPGADFDFRVESDNDTHALFVDASQDHVGIGTSNPIGKLFVSGNNTNFVSYFANDGNNDNRYGLSIKCGNDDASGTNYAVAFYDGDGTAQGFITFSGGTVTYGTFTAQHPCIIPDADNDSSSADNAYPYGTLLETTSISYTQKDGANTERGILYNVQKTSSAYSRKVLGAYGSCMNGGPTNQTNEHQALVLGDGHILCNNEKGNISAGDGICSSSTAGIGMKADKMAMIVGIAQEDVTFSGSETKLVAVQYGVRQFTPWTD